MQIKTLLSIPIYFNGSAVHQYIYIMQYTETYVPICVVYGVRCTNLLNWPKYEKGFIVYYFVKVLEFYYSYT